VGDVETGGWHWVGNNEGDRGWLKTSGGQRVATNEGDGAGWATQGGTEGSS